MEEIDAAVDARRAPSNLLIAHSTSAYPCPVDALNLRMIETLRARYPGCPIGYSGHETGLTPTWAAVTLGATFVERHITLDRAMWGSDQAASVEIGGLMRLCSNIRDIERSLGDGVKRVYAGGAVGAPEAAPGPGRRVADASALDPAARGQLELIGGRRAGRCWPRC